MFDNKKYISHIKKRMIILLDICFCLFMIISLSGCEAKQASTDPVTDPEETEDIDTAKEEYLRASELFDEGKFYSAKLAFENSGYDDYEQRALQCIQPMPETGELWHDKDMASDKMRLDFVVNEDDNAIGTYIAVYTEDNNLVETVFIQGSGTVETWIPGGTYCIKDASGTVWFGEKELFGKEGKYETMLFHENDDNPQLTALSEGYIWTITINSLDDKGGAIDTQENDWESWNY